MAMRVLVLHSDVAPDAPPEELDTLTTARAVADALQELGHAAALAPFAVSVAGVLSAVREARADIVFNMVENVLGQDSLAATAPALLDKINIPYTGSGAGPIALTGDKPLAKSILRQAGLPTPDWAEPPYWTGLNEGPLYIVKSATEDASLSLDDESVLAGRAAVASRARACAERHGGRWFAEAYIDGREFNVALMEDGGALRAFPIPEMRFEDWSARKPPIVGYRAKWVADSEECAKTTRSFGLERQKPELAAVLTDLAGKACRLLGLKGYARVDFRVDGEGQPTILEVNPNPCLDPDAGFAAAAAEAGLSYKETVARILGAATGK